MTEIPKDSMMKAALGSAAHQARPRPVGAMKRPYRVLIVDDHPVVRLGLRNTLSAADDLEVCGEADGAATALDALEQTRPDLVLVDISLKDGSGLDLVKRITHREPTVKVLVASMHDEALFAERALRAGAQGYINKEETIDGLVDAIRAVLGGSIALSQQMTDRMIRAITIGDPEKGKPLLDQLSDRELEVFELLGRGMTTREAANHLNLSVKTIETYRENIKEKLNLANNNELICRAAQWVVQQT